MHETEGAVGATPGTARGLVDFTPIHAGVGGERTLLTLELRVGHLGDHRGGAHDNTPDRGETLHVEVGERIHRGLGDVVGAEDKGANRGGVGGGRGGELTHAGRGGCVDLIPVLPEGELEYRDTGRGVFHHGFVKKGVGVRECGHVHLQAAPGLCELSQSAVKCGLGVLPTATLEFLDIDGGSPYDGASLGGR